MPRNKRRWNPKDSDLSHRGENKKLMIHERQMPKILEKEWGSELIIVNTPLYCGKIITIGKEWSSQGKYHKHKIKDETFYNHNTEGVVELELVVEEKGKIDYTVNFWLFPGETYRIEPGTYHRFKSPKQDKISFIEISSYDDPEDNYYGEIERYGDKDKPSARIKEVGR